MSKRFIVGVDDAPLEKLGALKEALGRNGAGWWHWIDGFWLVDTNEVELTPAMLRDRVHRVCPKCNVLVLEVSPVTWAAYGPESESRSFSKWIEEYWSKAN